MDWKVIMHMQVYSIPTILISDEGQFPYGHTQYYVWWRHHPHHPRPPTQKAYGRHMYYYCLLRLGKIEIGLELHG